MKKVDLNTATEKELLGIPGMSIDFVTRVLAWRETGRRFNKLEDLRYLKGLGPVAYRRLAPFFCVTSDVSGKEVDGPPDMPESEDVTADEAVFLMEAAHSAKVQDTSYGVWTEKEWRRAWLLSLEGPALVAGRLEDLPASHLKPLLHSLRHYQMGTCLLSDVYPKMEQAGLPAPSWGIVAALAYWTREMQRRVTL